MRGVQLKRRVWFRARGGGKVNRDGGWTRGDRGRGGGGW